MRAWKLIIIFSLTLWVIIVTGSAWGQAATPTITSTPAPTPTQIGGERATLFYRIGAENQPARSWANGGTFGIYMPSDGRLQDMQVICDASTTASFTFTKNGIATNVACSWSTTTGCRNLFAVTGHSVTYAKDDYINVTNTGASGRTCEITVGVLDQDSSEHNAIVAWGHAGSSSNNMLCIPVTDALAESECGGNTLSSSFYLPKAATVQNYSRNGNPCAQFCSFIDFIFVDRTTSSDLFTTTLPDEATAISGPCSGSCALTGGHQFHIRESTDDAIGWDTMTEILEFSGTGQIVTGRSAQWSTGEDRYITQHSPWETTSQLAVACAERGGVAKNLRIGLSAASAQNVTATVCFGVDPTSLSCTGPTCTITAGGTECSDLSTELVIPTGYVYTVKGTSPGQASGTFGFSFEIAPPATPISEVQGCGFETAINTPTPASATETPSITPTVTVTATPTTTPTITLTPTSTPTSTITATMTSSPTPTSTAPFVCWTYTPVPVATPTPKRQSMPYFFE